MRAGALSLFLSPYRRLEPVSDPAGVAARVHGLPGSALVWSLEEGDWGASFDLVRSRPGGVALIVILPRAEAMAQDREVLRVVELCRPHSILPYHPEPNPEDLRSLLSRVPEDLGMEVTDYIGWREIHLDGETRRLIRRTLELSSELKSVSGLSRSLYMSRRALGRRFLARGLPVPSHWLHMGRILRAALRLQSTGETLFAIACDLGYPDGFALSNQMYRLIGVRPTSARAYLGWEWLVESWLRKEAKAGALAAELPRSAVGPDSTSGAPAPRPAPTWRGQRTGRIAP